MAFVTEDPNKAKDESQTLNGTAGPDQAQQQQSAPSDTLNPATGAAPSGQPASGPAAQPSGSFSNTSAYIARNRPATQRLADRVSSSLQQTGQNARNTLQQQTTAYNNAVAGKTVNQDTGLLNQVLANPTNLSADQRSSILAQRDATYTGPKSLEESDFYSPVSQAFGQANQARELTKDVGGREQLIAGIAKPGQRLSKGRLALDEALLSADPNARATFQQGVDSLGDLDSRLAAASTAAQKQATDAANTTAATQAATRAAITGAKTGFQSDLDKRLAAAQSGATDRENAAKQALNQATTYLQNARGTEGKQAAPTFTDQQLSDLGLSRQFMNEILGAKGTKTGNEIRAASQKAYNGTDRQGQDYRYLDEYANGLGNLGKLATYQDPTVQINRANFATPEDYARYAALNDLAGENDLYLNPAEAANAGTANTDLTDFNSKALRDLHQRALDDIAGQKQKQIAVNARNGSGTWLKNNGALGVLSPLGSVLFGK